MPEGSVSPEECPRSLAAEALLWAHPDRPLFAGSLRVMAVANAFVMLGLLPGLRAGRAARGPVAGGCGRGVLPDLGG
jgi:hypothetical protein